MSSYPRPSHLGLSCQVRHVFISLGLLLLGHVFIFLGLHVLGPWDKEIFTRLCVNVLKLTSPRLSILLVINPNFLDCTSIKFQALKPLCRRPSNFKVLIFFKTSCPRTSSLGVCRVLSLGPCLCFGGTLNNLYILGFNPKTHALV